jgi:predicted amidohydrolase
MSSRRFILPVVAVVVALAAQAAVRADETSSAKNLITNPQFTAGSSAGSVAGWSFWSPRKVLASGSSCDGKTLCLSCDRFEQYGAWTTDVSNIQPGRFYRFEVLHRAKGVKSEDVSVAVIVTWHRAGEPRSELQRDYVEPIASDAEGWRTDARTLRAPDKAGSVTVELLLRWAPGGSVAFKSPRLTEVPPPAPRVARIITTHMDPSRPASVEGNTRLMSQMLDKVADQHPDLVLFSENFVDRGVRLPFDQKAQPIPGPLTEMLSKKAKAIHSYVVTTLHEVDQGVVYNTAVLIDRQGKLVGKYHKVQIAMAESEGGITPGSEFPVFQTDFGKVGILTCWDNWFSDAARVLRLKGAEILLFPLAGDGTPNHYEVTVRARAMDNGLYVISCPTLNDVPGMIVNPAGDVVARVTGPFNFAVADLDLNQEWRVRYLSVANGDGEAKSLYIKERRPDTYSDLVRDRRP